MPSAPRARDSRIAIVSAAPHAPADDLGTEGLDAALAEDGGDRLGEDVDLRDERRPQ